MALFRKIFYRKPPDGLLEISERVFVFDCCFTTDVLEEDELKVYMGGIMNQLREYFPDASFMVFNFREGESQSQIGNVLSEYDLTVMDYPRQYEGCPLLTMETIHHFLRSSESWLSLGAQNVLLLHCERGGWPVLAFMLAALLIYRKQYTGEQKTLDMIYKQAPRELLQLISPLNPLPSQLRYLQYVSRRNVGTVWPPLDRALTLDCVILRVIPNMDGEGGCRPIFRIYGQDPFMAADRTPKVLFSTPKRSKIVRYYKQADCELVKIDIHCHIQGDVVLECISLDNDLEREEMMFRVMFNTAFIRSNILMLNRDEIDVLWNGKDQFPKDFRAEVLFSEMDSASSLITIDLPGIEEKGLPIEAFAKVQEIFSNVGWLDQKADVALNMLQQITTSNILQERFDTGSPRSAEKEKMERESLSPQSAKKENFNSGSPRVSDNFIRSSSTLALVEESSPSFKSSSDLNFMIKQKIESQEPQVTVQRPALSKIISQRNPDSLSSPDSTSNSLQGSPVTMSRYNSAPSVLGITALLHDHAESANKEASPKVTTSPASAGSAPVPHVFKSVQPIKVSVPPPVIPSERQSSVLPPAPPPPPPLPYHHLSASESSAVLLNDSYGTSLQDRGELLVASSPIPTKNAGAGAAPPPPPPPLRSGSFSAPPPPPPPVLTSKDNSSGPGPPVPPPPAPFANGLPKASGPPHSAGSNGIAPPPPPFGAKGRLPSRTGPRGQPAKKNSLKPYHWLKLTRAMQGSLWAETQKSDEAGGPEFDMSELESLFSANPNSDSKGAKSNRRAAGPKSEKVNLIELRRAYNCEIMLTKVKVPLPDLMSLVLALDDSALDVDQVDNLIKFCPTKEEMELLKNYKGDIENLGKCEQVRNSVKLKRIMQTILSLGNALNHGTARGSAVGFRLDSLLKLTDTRARNNKLTLMHYLCKVLAEKLPELLDFPKDLVHLEAATKIQLKYLAEEMQALSKGLEKVVQELTTSENDGPVSEVFCKTLKDFLGFAESEVRSLASLYSGVGRNADALALYFGEDPARCPFEQVVNTLMNFVRMFSRAHDENCKHIELEKKKAQKEAEKEKAKVNSASKNEKMKTGGESKQLIQTQ
ncbi:hypothetical protein LguiA_036561 [Lonicera macranthoides]